MRGEKHDDGNDGASAPPKYSEQKVIRAAMFTTIDGCCEANSSVGGLNLYVHRIERISNSRVTN